MQNEDTSSRFNDTAGSPAVIAHTGRLLIRELSQADLEALAKLLAACPEIAPEWQGLDRDELAESLSSYINYQYGFYGYGLWGIFTGESEFAGIAGVINGDASQTGELSYALLPAFRHKGIAYEACRAILDLALDPDEIGFDSIYVRIRKNNKSSLALAGKLGIEIRLLPEDPISTHEN